jgi:hypothetical protein
MKFSENTEMHMMLVTTLQTCRTCRSRILLMHMKEKYLRTAWEIMMATLVNIGDYQSAQALSQKAIKIFEAILKPPAQDENHNTNRSIVSVSKVENGLVELNNLLNTKASPQDLMRIVHTQIHPSLQLAYDLES